MFVAWIMLIMGLSIGAQTLDFESVERLEALVVAEQNDSLSTNPYWRHGPRAVGYLSTALDDDYADQGGDPGERDYDRSIDTE